MPSETTIQAYVDRANPADVDRGVKRGLTRDEARREIAYDGMIGDEAKRRRGRACVSVTFTPADQRAVLGDAAYADMLALGEKTGRHHLSEVAAELAAHPITGPTSYYVPAGSTEAAVAEAKGADDRGVWANSPLDAQGGYTRSLVDGTPEGYAASLAAKYLPVEGNVTFVCMTSY